MAGPAGWYLASKQREEQLNLSGLRLLMVLDSYGTQGSVAINKIIILDETLKWLEVLSAENSVTRIDMQDIFHELQRQECIGLVNGFCMITHKGKVSLINCPKYEAELQKWYDYQRRADK